jgi:hypothetical protein
VTGLLTPCVARPRSRRPAVQAAVVMTVTRVTVGRLAKTREISATTASRRPGRAQAGSAGAGGRVPGIDLLQVPVAVVERQAVVEERDADIGLPRHRRNRRRIHNATWNASAP